MNTARTLRKTLRRVKGVWRPLRIATLNNYEFSLTTFSGDFIWHQHEQTDIAFLVVSGELRVDFRRGSVRLQEGDLYVIPKGTEHKPFSSQECGVLVIAPSGTLNTGNVRNEYTVYNPDTL